MERTKIKNTVKGGPTVHCGRQASAYGLILPSTEKKYLNTSMKNVFLHHQAVQFSTGTAVQFSPGIYTYS